MYISRVPDACTYVCARDVERERERNVLVISFDVNHICTTTVMNLFMISQLHSSSIYIIKKLNGQRSKVLDVVYCDTTELYGVEWNGN